MKILKIFDGFITNSSTDSATILLAVKKGKELKKLIKELELPEDFPKVVLRLTDDETKIQKLVQEMGMKLEFMLKEYNLYMNIVQNSELAPVPREWEFRHDQMRKMIGETMLKQRNGELGKGGMGGGMGGEDMDF